jgi:hypothetical protein
LLPAWAAAYAVLNLDDSGPGSLRWCIEQANAHAASDTITFDKLLSGGVIRPLTGLPELTGYYGDTLDGDVNDDGKPDFTIKGDLLDPMYPTSGLKIYRPESPAGLLPLEAPLAPVVPGARIIGMAVISCPGPGISIMGRGGNTIRSCHIGVNRGGNVAFPNTQAGIFVYESHGNTIGGTPATARNVIVGPEYTGYPHQPGMLVHDCDSTVVIGNYFGTNRNGTAGLGTGAECLRLEDGSGNRVGGSGASRNLFCQQEWGVVFDAETDGRVQGNYFGLGSDGSTPIPLQADGLRVGGGATGFRIGGTTAGVGNVFGAGNIGLTLADMGTADNEVLGNTFGSTADGTTQLDLEYGVKIGAGADAQTIGGTAAGAGNYFTANTERSAVEVVLGGSGTHVEGNTFGLLRSGTAVPIGEGVIVAGAEAYITDNTFARANMGIAADEARVYAFRNLFRGCETAVWAGPAAQVILGNLGNASTTDDGGNVFRTTNTVHIRNGSPDRLRAEGNSFGTTVQSEIDAKIWDKLDDPALGRVDFIPLDGGVIPTGAAGTAALTVTGAAAVPTAKGAEIAFTLSAPARVTVTILNIAGRPLATIAADAPTSAGLQRLVWTGRTAGGTAAPAGSYLVRITARGENGRGSTCLARLLLLR